MIGTAKGLEAPEPLAAAGYHHQQSAGPALLSRYLYARSSFSRAAGCMSMASRSSGRPARPSAAVGATSRDEATWKSPGQLIRMLVNTVSTGGNLLMNVGPTARGELDARAEAALGVYRDWMAQHSEAIYGCTASAHSAPQDCRLTQNGDRLYAHYLRLPLQALAYRWHRRPHRLRRNFCTMAARFISASMKRTPRVWSCRS